MGFNEAYWFFQGYISVVVYTGNSNSMWIMCASSIFYIYFLEKLRNLLII